MKPGTRFVFFFLSVFRMHALNLQPYRGPGQYDGIKILCPESPPAFRKHGKTQRMLANACNAGSLCRLCRAAVFRDTAPAIAKARGERSHATYVNLCLFAWSVLANGK